MKVFIFLFLVFLPFLPGCEKENFTFSNSEIREIAWNSLSEQEKSSVIINWENAPVIETAIQEKNVFAVSFNTSDDALLGPVIVYIDRTTLVVLGKGLRM